MTDRLDRLGPALLIAALAVAVLVGSLPGLELASPDRTRTTGLRATLATLPDDPVVLVAFDPDLGTYAEIRPAVRALLADLLERGASLGLVSFTPEGRALAVAELERMASDVAPDRLTDLGFLPGAEAAIVRAIDRPVRSDAAVGAAATALEAGGLAAASLAVVVGGNDIGPRTWVEQVGTRVRGLPLVAVAPTYQLPELEPYLETGQLRALLGTLRDGRAYRDTLALDREAAVADDRPVGSLPVLLGMLIAVGALAQVAGVRVTAILRAALPRDAE